MVRRLALASTAEGIEPLNRCTGSNRPLQRVRRGVGRRCYRFTRPFALHFFAQHVANAAELCRTPEACRASRGRPPWGFLFSIRHPGEGRAHAARDRNSPVKARQINLKRSHIGGNFSLRGQVASVTSIAPLRTRCRCPTHQRQRRLRRFFMREFCGIPSAALRGGSSRIAHNVEMILSGHAEASARATRLSRTANAR
jgi:hypothetical protein